LLRLKGIQKSFGGNAVIKGIDLEAGKGEFITILGPSGCGKTTLLRIIAGLEDADEGSVFLNNIDVTKDEPHKRDVRMVFQNYALFPHMNVEANIAYSLRIKNFPSEYIKREAASALEMVQLSGYEKRKPSELSGGQRQRVALARALITKPPLLLLDEPLGALDLKLRRQMQLELKRLQKQLGITFIYITHDQEEALTMSDRIAVMRDGVFEQTGSAREIYDQPKTAFAASFVGNANIIKGKLAGRDQDGLVLEHPAGRFRISADKTQSGNIAPGAEITAAVRCEYVGLKPAAESGSAAMGLRAVVTGKSFAGGQFRVSTVLEDNEGRLYEELGAARYGIEWDIEPGQRVFADWDSPLNARAVEP
jgi:spermidine/putrescine transport system ATP-binding protein